MARTSSNNVQKNDGKPHLEPVLLDKEKLPENFRDGPFRYCRLRNRDGKLEVKIENSGEDMLSEFRVEVDFYEYSLQLDSKVSPPLKKGNVKSVYFEIPSGAKEFNFNINIYIGDILDSQTLGMCVGEILGS